MKPVYLLVFLGIVLFTFTSSTMQPKGIRNNNPGNIRYVPSNNWDGQTGHDGTGFAVFSHWRFGVRAISKLLNTYFNGHGIRTIRGILNRYAPPVENDTGAYVAHVAKAAGVLPDAPMTATGFHNAKPEIIKAIIRHENGQQPYDTEVIANLANNPDFYGSVA